MNQSAFQSAITNALRQTDNIVWTYAESHDYLTLGGVSQDWTNAIWNARNAAGVPFPGVTASAAGTSNGSWNTRLPMSYLP